ncbi:hypothetical protein ACN27G_27550 [Plantactinospora sp. WMMB334]|uniref:hypothetical protein n=1 Tax=Plantactinospora sp. WMMB334 TaxID=3404119 RepID=UPI003B961B1A
MTIETPRPREADVAEALADPGRLARSKESHAEGLRKLATAVQVAIGRGATWAETLAVVERAAAEEASTSRLAATARARVHDGNDSF